MAKRKNEQTSGGASTEEARKIHDVVRRHSLPAGINSFLVKFGEDSAGERAVWISFVVGPEFSESKHSISALNRFVREVRSDLLSAKLPYWPYLDIVGASAEAQN